MDEDINDPITLTLCFDHKRSIDTIRKQDEELYLLVEESRENIVNIISKYQAERQAALSSLNKSKDERHSFVAEKMDEMKEKYMKDLNISESTATSHELTIASEWKLRLQELEDAILLDFEGQTSEHSRRIELSYVDAMQHLKHHICEQESALELELEHIEGSIKKSEADIDAVRKSLLATEDEFISTDKVHASEERYQQLKDKLLEADRQVVAVRNFGRQCESLTSKILDIRLTIARMMA